MHFLLNVSLFRPQPYGIGAYRFGLSIRPSSLSCVTHISKTERPENLILVSLESSRPVDVPFGTFGQIRPTDRGQIGRNGRKVVFSTIKFEHVISSVLMALES